MRLFIKGHQSGLYVNNVDPTVDFRLITLGVTDVVSVISSFLFLACDAIPAQIEFRIQGSFFPRLVLKQILRSREHESVLEH